MLWISIHHHALFGNPKGIVRIPTLAGCNKIARKLVLVNSHDFKTSSPPDDNNMNMTVLLPIGNEQNLELDLKVLKLRNDQFEYFSKQYYVKLKTI